MQLSERSLVWLRAFDAVQADPAAVASAACALGLLAAVTPAWRELHATHLDALATVAPSADRALVAAVRDAVAGTAAVGPRWRDVAEAAAASEAGPIVHDAGGVAAWARLCTAPIVPCPQVIGIDAPGVLLRRAEWVTDSLFVGLAPLVDQPDRKTEFRLVGGEPRMWYITGVDDVMTDVSSHGMWVRVPRVATEIVFTPGSY
jgi:hypothetical protein